MGWGVLFCHITRNTAGIVVLHTSFLFSVCIFKKIHIRKDSVRILLQGADHILSLLKTNQPANCHCLLSLTVKVPQDIPFIHFYPGKRAFLSIYIIGTQNQSDTKQSYIPYLMEKNKTRGATHFPAVNWQIIQNNW